jgi:hypothetical protein
VRCATLPTALATRVTTISGRVPASFRRIAFGLVLVFAALTLALLFWSNVHRLPEYVEAFCLHNARRIQEGLPLYVDPTVGANEYGEPPSRWFVGYAAPFAALLSLFPLEPMWGRSVCGVAFMATLLACARKDGQWSISSLACAGMVLVSFRVSQFAFSARPDSIALAFAGIAYARTLRLDRVDRFCAVGFGIAMLIKPNVLSLGASAMLWDIVRHRRISHTVPMLVTLLCGASVLHFVSGGMWLAHMKGGVGPSFSPELIVHNVLGSGPFVLFPALIALSTTSPRARIGVCVTVLFASLQFAKIGGAPNYWLEPCVACVAALSYTTRPMRMLETSLVYVHIAWNAPILWHTWVEEWSNRGVNNANLAGVRSLCGEGFIFSSDLGTEWALNRRIHVIPLELYLQRTPELEARWTEDFMKARCFVANTWPALNATVDMPFRVHYPQIANALLRDRFERVDSQGGIVVFRAKYNR